MPHRCQLNSIVAASGAWGRARGVRALPFKVPAKPRRRSSRRSRSSKRDSKGEGGGGKEEGGKEEGSKEEGGKEGGKEGGGDEGGDEGGKDSGEESDEGSESAFGYGDDYIQQLRPQLLAVSALGGSGRRSWVMGETLTHLLVPTYLLTY